MSLERVLIGWRCSLSVVVLAILHRFSNWKSFLVKRLTGSKTLPADFSSKVRVQVHRAISRRDGPVKTDGCCFFVIYSRVLLLTGSHPIFFTLTLNWTEERHCCCLFSIVPIVRNRSSSSPSSSSFTSTQTFKQYISEVLAYSPLAVPSSILLLHLV